MVLIKAWVDGYGSGGEVERRIGVGGWELIERRVCRIDRPGVSKVFGGILVC